MERTSRSAAPTVPPLVSKNQNAGANQQCGGGSAVGQPMRMTSRFRDMAGMGERDRWRQRSNADEREANAVHEVHACRSVAIGVLARRLWAPFLLVNRSPGDDLGQDTFAASRRLERLLQELQRAVPRRTAQRRDLLQPQRGANPDRTVEEALQHETTTQCTGLSPTDPGNRRPDGPNAGHALTIKPGHSGRADQTAWIFATSPTRQRRRRRISPIQPAGCARSWRPICHDWS